MASFFNLTKKAYCKKINKQESTDILSSLLPDGIAWLSKNTENQKLRLYLQGVSGEVLNLINIIATVCEDFAPAFTNYFIDKWEELVGIPDSCFQRPNTLEERRDLIISKISLMRPKTIDDYKVLANFLGYRIEFSWANPENTFPYEFPHFLGDTSEELFKVYISVFPLEGNFNAFPYEFPHILGSPVGKYALECVFNKIKPAHITLIFTYYNV